MGLLDQFREKVLYSVFKDESEVEQDRDVDNLIALGVLLWAVAEADEKFLPQEHEKIQEVLRIYDDITDADMPIVLRSIKEASINRIDIQSFTNEVSTNLPKEMKIEIVENLFRVACIDQELDEKEVAMIGKISDLFWLDQQDLVNAKVKVKKEFGMDTAGL